MTSVDIILRSRGEGNLARSPFERARAATLVRAQLAFGHQECGLGRIALDHPGFRRVVLRRWALPARLPPDSTAMLLAAHGPSAEAPPCVAAPPRRCVAHAGDVGVARRRHGRCMVISERVSVPVLSDADDRCRPQRLHRRQLLDDGRGGAPCAARPSPAPPTGWPAGLRARRPRPATPPAAAPSSRRPCSGCPKPSRTVATTTAAITSTATPSMLADPMHFLLQRRRRLGRGVQHVAMAPISVCMPVAVTMACRCPAPPPCP
jgi:hypothetical protein